MKKIIITLKVNVSNDFAAKIYKTGIVPLKDGSVMLGKYKFKMTNAIIRDDNVYYQIKGE